MRLSLSGQYYHKIASYNDDIRTASFPRLIDQDWNTDDVNVRMTFRPKIPNSLGTLALITRYDFIRTSIDGQWEIFSDGELLDEQQTGVITKHVITESINWSPLARLYFQADVSYVLDQTDTPASSINLIPNTSPTVVNFRNDYWTVTASAGYILDDKTDLHAEYTFYRANDYFNNSGVSVPYGMGASEHTASVSMSAPINKTSAAVAKVHLLQLHGHDHWRATTITRRIRSFRVCNFDFSAQIEPNDWSEGQPRRCAARNRALVFPRFSLGAYARLCCERKRRADQSLSRRQTVGRIDADRKQNGRCHKRLAREFAIERVPSRPQCRNAAELGAATALANAAGQFSCSR